MGRDKDLGKTKKIKAIHNTDCLCWKCLKEYDKNMAGAVFELEDIVDDYDDVDNKMYKNANYYSLEEVAENNCRADKLMRQLRRFSVEHRERPLVCGKNGALRKYHIVFSCYQGELNVLSAEGFEEFGVIYFESAKVAKLAIDTFHDELIWYFTEYKDSL